MPLQQNLQLVGSLCVHALIAGHTGMMRLDHAGVLASLRVPSNESFQWDPDLANQQS